MRICKNASFSSEIDKLFLRTLKLYKVNTLKFFALLGCMFVMAGNAWARTPLTQAAFALLPSQAQLRFTTFGEEAMAPVRIFRDAQRTYIEIRQDVGQKLDVLEVTPIGYRRIPSTFEPPYIVIQGFATSLAIQYPGKPLVFVELGAEAIRQPADPLETELRMRERAGALLERQTQLDAAELAFARKTQTERAKTEHALRDAQAQQARAAQELAAAQANAAKPRRAYDVFKVDQTLRGVLTRWAANDGLQLEWSAPHSDKWNPPVAADGPVQASDIKDAIQKILLAFTSRDVALQATFFNNNVVEISQKPGAQQP